MGSNFRNIWYWYWNTMISSFYQRCEKEMIQHKYKLLVTTECLYICNMLVKKNNTYYYGTYLRSYELRLKLDFTFYNILLLSKYSM